ncbi:hypothetical protein SRHO_G00146890 [Serrasalmus rhombeus]
MALESQGRANDAFDDDDEDCYEDDDEDDDGEDGGSSIHTRVVRNSNSEDDKDEGLMEVLLNCFLSASALLEVEVPSTPHPSLAPPQPRPQL